jgi:hypothetical protein
VAYGATTIKPLVVWLLGLVKVRHKHATHHRPGLRQQPCLAHTTDGLSGLLGMHQWKMHRALIGRRLLRELGRCK